MKVTFPKKRAGELRACPFDFTSSLSAAVTLVSATCTASVYSGNDASPSALLSGSPTVSGNVATQLTTGGVSGTIYSLLCKGTLSDGQQLDIQGFLAIGQDAV